MAPVDKELLIQVLTLYNILANTELPKLRENLLDHLYEAFSNETSPLLDLVHDAGYNEESESLRR